MPQLDDSPEPDWTAFDRALRRVSAPDADADLAARCLPDAPDAAPLIVAAEDEPNIRRLVEVHLAAEGYRVLALPDGESALAAVRLRRPNLVILDVMMPGMSGLDVLAAIKSDPDLAATPVLMLTARDRDDDIRRGWQRGNDFYFPKPFNPLELRSVVRALLEAADSPDGPAPLRTWVK